MRSALLASALSLLATPSYAECGPAVRFRGEDPALIQKVREEVSGDAARSLDDGSDEDGGWGCPVMEVVIEQAGDRINLLRIDEHGDQTHRSVRDPAMAAALVESWTASNSAEVAPRFRLFLRPEVGFGGVDAWALVQSLGAALRLWDNFFLEVTGRAGFMSPADATRDIYGNGLQPLGDFELAGGFAYELRLPGYGFWFSLSAGTRQLAGFRRWWTATLEPSAGFYLALTRTSDLELRLSPQLHWDPERDQPLAGVMRVGLGLRWSIP
ncbi:MAG: hypothetical protein U1E65_30960 [Myxococcota bacterium]